MRNAYAYKIWLKDFAELNFMQMNLSTASFDYKHLHGDRKDFKIAYTYTHTHTTLDFIVHRIICLYYSQCILLRVMIKNTRILPKVLYVAKETESAVESRAQLRNIMINRLRHVYTVFCIVNASFDITLNINAKQQTSQ